MWLKMLAKMTSGRTNFDSAQSRLGEIHGHGSIFEVTAEGETIVLRPLAPVESGCRALETGRAGYHGTGCGGRGEMGEARQMKPLRVVLDTNVVLSTLLFAVGRLTWLRDSWQTERIKPLLSRDTADELVRALTYPKFKLDQTEQHELLGEYLPWCETLAVPARRMKIPQCRDPFDVPFLRLSLFGKADFLVSGDKDLLALAEDFLRSPLVAPGELRNRL